VGIGGYWIAITAHHNAPGTMTPQEAHNDYLELLASGGIVGFAIGVWLACVVFKLIRRNLQTGSREANAICLASVVGLSGPLLHSIFDFGLHLMINSLVFVILLALATMIVQQNGRGEFIDLHGSNK
jgi:O-antigen ligase